MLKLSLLFLVIAIATATFGDGGVAKLASDVAIVLFLVFGLLFVSSFFFGGGDRAAIGIGGAVGVLAAGVLAVWLSDRYSLEAAGAKLDATLADAREGLDGLVEDLPEAARDAREGVAAAIDAVPEAAAADAPETGSANES